MIDKKSIENEDDCIYRVNLILSTDGINNFWLVLERGNPELYDNPKITYSLETYDQVLNDTLKSYGSVFIDEENDFMLPFGTKFYFDENHLKPGIHTIRRVKTSA